MGGQGLHREPSGSSDGAETSRLEPDPEAQSNKMDMQAATAFYRLMQDSLLVPLMIISRHTINVCRLPLMFFNELNTCGGKLGVELHYEWKVADEKMNAIPRSTLTGMQVNYIYTSLAILAAVPAVRNKVFNATQ